MKKEKQVRTYQRKTKSGKVVVVRAHKAKYDAAEDLKKSITKKKGSGLEMESLKNENIESPFGIEMDDFKEWYAFNDWDIPKKEWPVAVRRVDKALVSGMGKKSYDDFCAKVDESWTARGYKRAMKDLSAFSNPKSVPVPQKSPIKGMLSNAEKAKRTKAISDEIEAHGNKSYSKEEGEALLKRAQEAGFNMYKLGGFYNGYKFNNLDTMETLWMNVSTDKRGRMHFDTMHPYDRDEYYNYYEKERAAAKKKDMERQKARMAAIQKADKRDSWLKTSDITLEKLGSDAVKGQVVFGKHNVRVIVEPDDRNGGYFVSAYDTKTNKSYLYNTHTLSDLSKGVIDRISAKKKSNSQGDVEKGAIDYGTLVIGKGYYKGLAKKVAKGSFHTFDENGNEIPDAPKHGTKFKADKVAKGWAVSSSWKTPSDVIPVNSTDDARIAEKLSQSIAKKYTAMSDRQRSKAKGLIALKNKIDEELRDFRWLNRSY